MAKPAPQNLKQSLPGLRRILERFWPYLMQEKALIAGSALALFAGVLLRLLEPWPLKFVFDRLFGGRDRRLGDAEQHSLAAMSPTLLLSLAAGALLLIVALRAACDYANTVGFAKLGNRVLLKVRNELYRHLQQLPLSFHTKARTGDLTIRVIGDVNMLRDATVTAILPLVANTLVVVGMWAVMLWMQWRLALLAAAALPLLWFWTTRTGRRIRDAARQQRQREGAMASTAAEALGAIKNVQALGLEPVFADAFLSRSKDSQKQDVRTAKLTARLERTVDVILAAATAAVLWYGARLVIDARITPGDLLVFLTYLRRAFNPVQDFAKYTGRLAKATAAGERVLDLLDRQREVRDQPDARPCGPLRGHVRFESVTFEYESECPVLDRVDFEITPGRRVALVGPSGIGKSTVVNLLLRLYDPQAGRITIDGRDIRQFTLDSLRSQVSVVMQDSVLFAVSVRDNIAYGVAGIPGETDPPTREQIETAARLASAHDFITALPQGYDTVLGERGVTLSGGQRQRIALARAAIRQAPILVLDEPTTGLDEENESAILEALSRLGAGRTTLYISHDLRLASRADEVLYLEAGRIIERGTHAQLMARPTRYAALYAAQSAESASQSPAACVEPAAAVAPVVEDKPHAVAF